MVCDSVELSSLGLTHWGMHVTNPIEVRCLDVFYPDKDYFTVPKELEKVHKAVNFTFTNRIRCATELFSQISERCGDNVTFYISRNYDSSQADWDWLLENLVNNDSLKFKKYSFYLILNEDIVFNVNTDKCLSLRTLNIGNLHKLTLNGKLGVLELFKPCKEDVIVNCKFRDIVDNHGNNIIRDVFDYGNLPDLYESLEDRLRRLIETGQV